MSRLSVYIMLGYVIVCAVTKKTPSLVIDNRIIVEMFCYVTIIIIESTRFNCQFYLRSSLRYSMIDTPPDIGNDDIVTLQQLLRVICTVSMYNTSLYIR